MSIFTKLFGNHPAAGNGSFDLKASEYKNRFCDSNTPHLLIDVRSPAEFAEGHITGARNIPLQEIERRLKEVPKDKPIILYCRSGNRSGMALQMLRSAGYETVYNAGGVSELAKQGLPVNHPARR